MNSLSLRSLGAACVSCFGLTALSCASSSSDQATPTYCDVQPILLNKCQRCHQDPPKNGAPFPLLSYADTQVSAPTPSDPERKRYDQMRVVVESGAMPDRTQNLSPPVSGLTCEERATLLAWLRADAPPAADGTSECGSVPPKLWSCD